MFDLSPSMSKIRLAAGLALLLPLAAMAGAARAADAAPACSNATLSGTYLYSYTGTALTGKDRGPFAYAGYDKYDGQGRVRGIATSSTNGKIDKRARYGGTFAVYSNCTGVLTYTDGTAYDLYVAPDGSAVTFTQTTSGTVVTGTEHRVWPAAD